MPGRSFSSEKYRYGFNGKENDKDINEGGQDYGMRISDTRLGRFLSVDPLTQKYPWYTPYQFAGNIPIWAVDLDGGEPRGSTTTAVPEVIPEQVTTPTNIPGGGASNTSVGSGGIIQRTNSPSLPTGSGLLPAQTKFLSRDEIMDRIPPYCQGFSINSDGTTAGVTGANGTSRNISLLKPEPPKLDPKLAAAANNQFFKNAIQLYSNANVSSSASEFKKDQPGVEYFYRAMSLTEFSNTGGLIQARGGDRNDYPFITPNLGYLTNSKSFIWKPANAGKYDLIIRYAVQTGTESYLNSVSQDHGINVSQQAFLSNVPIKKIEQYTVFGGLKMPNTNFGFPGLSGSGHFNPRIIGMTVIPISADGLKDK